MASLTSIPELVMNEILKNLNFREVQTLRKVCHHLRKFIGDHKPDAKIGSIYLNIHDKDILVDYGNQNVVEYRHRGSNKYFLATKKILRYPNYVERFLKDFEIISRFQSSALNLLSLSMEQNANDNYSKTLELLAAVSNSRKPLLKTKKLEMDVLDQHQLLSILRCLDSNVLNAIEIRDPLSRHDSEPMESEEIVKSDQWMNSKEVWISSRRFPFRPENFQHFSRVTVFVDRLHAEQLEDVKKMFLQSSTMSSFLIIHSAFENEEQYFRSFGHSYKTDDADIWYFRNKNSGDILEIKRWVTMRQIRLVRLSPSEAVGGIVIRD